MDTYGDGTYVAGIVLAETNNNDGTAGVGFSPNIRVMPLRVCDEAVCPSNAIAEAIYYAADHGANEINMSLGGRIGATVVVTIQDAGGNPVGGATVSGTWNDSYSGSFSGLTCANGTVGLTSG